MEVSRIVYFYNFPFFLLDFALVTFFGICRSIFCCMALGVRLHMGRLKKKTKKRVLFLKATSNRSNSSNIEIILVKKEDHKNLLRIITQYQLGKASK